MHSGLTSVNIASVLPFIVTHYPLFTLRYLPVIVYGVLQITVPSGKLEYDKHCFQSQNLSESWICISIALMGKEGEANRKVEVIPMKRETDWGLKCEGISEKSLPF